MRAPAGSAGNGTAQTRRTLLAKTAGTLVCLLVGSAGVCGAGLAWAQPPAGGGTAAGPVTEKATFAGGCFWCVEADFDKVVGVISTTSGYIGGSVAKPTYVQVSAGRSGHAEAVEIVFDPRQVRYEQLLSYFWRTIDPTTLDRQFCDVGSPYRTAIFTHGPAQAAAAQASLAALEKSKPFKEPIVTTIAAAGTFYPAEDYHQDYYKKNPLRYQYYRASCGRDLRLAQLWGKR
jgi:peptide-methionine (S)-S-oxide reductase